MNWMAGDEVSILNVIVVLFSFPFESFAYRVMLWVPSVQVMLVMFASAPVHAVMVLSVRESLSQLQTAKLVSVAEKFIVTSPFEKFELFDG